MQTAKDQSQLQAQAIPPDAGGIADGSQADGSLTVHKSQGATYSDFVHDCDNKHPQKLVHVALSRCTDLNRLHRTNVNDDSTFYHTNESIDQDLEDEFRRLENHHLPTMTKSCKAVLQEPHSIAVAALNVRPLGLHSKGLSPDLILNKVPLLCRGETRYAK